MIVRGVSGASSGIFETLAIAKPNPIGRHVLCCSCRYAKADSATPPAQPQLETRRSRGDYAIGHVGSEAASARPSLEVEFEFVKFVYLRSDGARCLSSSTDPGYCPPARGGLAGGRCHGRIPRHFILIA